MSAASGGWSEHRPGLQPEAQRLRTTRARRQVAPDPAQRQEGDHVPEVRLGAGDAAELAGLLANLRIQFLMSQHDASNSGAMTTT